MNLLFDFLGLLSFRSGSLRALAARRSIAFGLCLFSAGFLAFVLVRNEVYWELQTPESSSPALFDTFFHLNLLQAVLFLSLVYVPTIVCLGNSISGFGLSLSRDEYRKHFSALFPLWGLLLLITSPLQWLLPQFVVVGIFAVTVGLFAFLALTLVYTVWAVKELGYLSVPAALSIFLLSWITFPIFYLLTMFLFALPLFIMIPLGYLLFQRLRTSSFSRHSERDFQHHLKSLTANPQDADAHYQLGLIHMRKGNLESAQTYFIDALKIDPNDADYHYALGRVFEKKGDWTKALQHYEDTYRLSPEYRLGDIFREVGKGYLHTGMLEKAIEFLGFFLKSRGSDPEGRYWLAVTLKKRGDLQDMRVQLNTILDQARSNPRFFSKEKREWIYRARALLRGDPT
jgi:tetratricopeptide (TPR) repeat protein